MPIEIPDWSAVLVLLELEDARQHIQIPSPALAYSKWELRGLLGVSRQLQVLLRAGPGEWLLLEANSLYPFYFKHSMTFRAEADIKKLL